MSQKKQIRKDQTIGKSKVSKRTAGFADAGRMGKRKIILPALIIALFGFLLYANSISNGFVLDDASAIKDNWLVKQGVSAIPTIFETPYRYGYRLGQDELYRPLPLAFFATLWQWFPDNPLPGHLINVVLYALTGYLLYLVLRKILPKTNPVIPFIACLLFMAHPIHTEVVANIKSFDEINAFLFILLTLLLVFRYLESNSLKHLLLAWLCFFIAFLSKEGTVTMLAVIPLILVLFMNTPKAKIIRITLILSSVAAIYFLMRTNALGSLTGDKNFSYIDNVLKKAPDVLSRFATSFFVLGLYIRLLFFPHPLSSDYSYPQIELHSWDQLMPWLSLAFHLGFLWVAYYTWRRNKIIVFAILFYFITISLYTNILVTIGSVFAERFLYVPQLSFALLIAWLLTKLSKVSLHAGSMYSEQNIFEKKNAFVLLLSTVILIPYSVKTIARNSDWQSEYKLYSADALNTPNSARIHLFHGNELLQSKGLKATDEKIKVFYLDSAIAEYTRSINLCPDFPEPWGQMGYAYAQKGNEDKAFEYYNKAIALKATSPAVYNNLGGIYFRKQKDYNKALEYYQQSVALDTHFAEGWRNIGSAYGMTGQFDKALDAFREALKYTPDNPDVLMFIGQTYLILKDTASAKPYFEKAYEVNPALRPK